MPNSMNAERLLPATSDVISQLRFPLILLVTFAHSYSAVRADYQPFVSGWDSYELLKLLVSQSMVKVSVPVFFIISGYLFFARVKQWDAHVYRKKLLRRARTLLLPYVVWNALMAVKLNASDWQVFWAFWPKVGCQTDWLGFDNYMTAPADMPLWFLRDLMGITLLAPLLHWLLSCRRCAAWFVVLLVVLFLSGVGAFVVPGLSVCALCFFTIGAWVAIHCSDLIEWARRWELPAYALSPVLLVAMLVTYRQPVFSSLMLAFRLTGAVAVLCLASRLLSVTSRRLPAVVCRSSYLLYLGHYVFFLSWVDHAIFWLVGCTSAWALCLHYLLAPLVKSAVFVLLYAAYSYISERKKVHFF